MTQCAEFVRVRRSVGYTAGKERFTAGGLRQCGRDAVDGVHCSQHAKQAAHIAAVNAARRAERKGTK